MPLGNLLIVSEDGDPTDPDDDAHGGAILIDFDQPQSIYSIQLVDINRWGGLIRAFADDGSWLGDTYLEPLGENSVQTVQLNWQNIGRLAIYIRGGGGVANIVFSSSG